MRHLFSTLLACLLAASVEAATVGVYFDDEGKVSARGIQAGQSFDLYVVIKDLPDGMLAFEICVVVPDGISIIYSRMHPSVAHSPPGQACPTPTMDSCVDVGESMWVIRFLAVYERAAPPPDDLVCVWALPDSPFPKEGSYLNCEREERPLHFATVGDGYYLNGCAVLNPTRALRVGLEEGSWAALKALY